jgi:hypothetical protein
MTAGFWVPWEYSGGGPFQYAKNSAEDIFTATKTAILARV